MILLTGAAGKTGRAILQALARRGEVVRVLVRTHEQSIFLSNLGAQDSLIGDLRDKSTVAQAVQGCESIYFICPNLTPDEVQIGESLLESARVANAHRFVYHSVLHPHVESMPHHWQKMRMEERLFESGIDFTILQPCAYMQNILSNWKSIIEQGVYAVPYATSARISIVDINDVAEAAAVVLTDEKHSNAIYELAGPQPLSQVEVAAILSTILGIVVKPATIDRKVWAESDQKSNFSDYQIKTLLLMFEYYEKYGLVGNSNILSQLINRTATTFENFLNHHIPNVQPLIQGGTK